MNTYREILFLLHVLVYINSTCMHVAVICSDVHSA